MEEEFIYDHRPLYTERSEKKAKSCGAEAEPLQESQEETKAENHHDVDILKFCVTETSTRHTGISVEIKEKLTAPVSQNLWTITNACVQTLAIFPR